MSHRVEDIYALSPLQEGMLYHALRGGDGGTYIEQLQCRIIGRLDVAAFRDAWVGLIARHAVLRTAFVWEDVEAPVQVVLRHVDLPLTIESGEGKPIENVRALFTDAAARDRRRGFDLSKAPLLAVRLCALGHHEHLFALTYHHLLLDGWSMAMLFDELFILYAAAAGSTDRAPDRRPYRDFIGWLRRQDLNAARQFWMSTLVNLPAPTPLPLASPPTTNVTAIERTRVVSPSGLPAWCRNRKLTPGTVLQAAWALVLARLTGYDDVVFGLTVAGRTIPVPGADAMLGLLINTVPLRIGVPRGTITSSWLAGVQTRFAELSQFEHTPLARIQEWTGTPSPLFETLLVIENYPSARSERAVSLGLEIAETQVFERTSYPLTLVAVPDDDLTFRVIVDPARIREDAADRLLEYIARAVDSLMAGWDRAVGSLSVVGADEQQRALVQGGANRPGDRDATLVTTRVEEQAATRGDHPAVVAASGVATTFGELNAGANRLARALRELGVGREDRVGTCFDRIPDGVTAQLAILKAGGAYVPLDPVQPLTRLRLFAADAGIRVVVTTAAHADWWTGTVNHVIAVDRDRDTLSAHSSGNLDLDSEARSLAYVIFTSGTTGRPKGVAVTHGGLRNLVDWHHAAFGTTAKDRQSHVASPGFDASVWEVWPCLTAGATLHMAHADVVRDPEALCEWLLRRRITTAFVPTPLAEALLGLEWPADSSLRWLLTGGDRLRTFAPSTIPFQLVNNYGPTEHTVVATSGRVRAQGTDTEGMPSLGAPIAGTRAYVLDETLQPVATGVDGDLYVAGPGIARGYWNQPGLTAERFLPDPFGGSPGDRMYATGDRVRVLRDGDLAFRGRRDRQVKVRGFRIELAEIEGALLALPDVKDVAVTHRRDDADDRLLAYVVAGKDVAFEGLEKALAESLPDYMVPRAWMRLERLPLTVHGKVDRLALPAPDVTGAPDAVVPTDPLESIVAGIWQEVLTVGDVARDDDFFALGGHSLSAVRVLSRIRATWPLDLPLATLFERPTVAALASAVREALATATDPGRPPLVPRMHSGPIPLSFAQERLWFLEQLPVSVNPYHIALAFDLDGHVEAVAIERAIALVVDGHTALRATFHVVDGKPVQRIEHEVSIALERQVVDPDRPDAVERAIEAEVRRPFDLERGPVIRARLLSAADHHVLVLVVHHIAADGWSMNILAKALTEALLAVSTGQPARLSTGPLQYTDFASWQREWLDRGSSASLDHWHRTLTAVPALELPSDRRRPAVQDHRGRTCEFSVPAIVTTSLDALGRREHVTPFMTLLAALAVLLHRYTGQDDFAIGSPVSGRMTTGTEQLVGCFVNTIALRVRPRPAIPFRQLLADVRRTVIEALTHQDVPFEQLVQALNPGRDLSRSPIFQTMFVWQNMPSSPVEAAGASWRPRRVDTGSSKFDLTLTMARDGDRLVGTFEYSSALFDAQTIERLARHFTTLLTAVADLPHRPIGDMPLVDDEERTTLVTTWNEPTSALAACDCLHTRFETRVARTPHAVAVTGESLSLTYAEVNAQATAVAAALVEAGVTSGDRVALCLDRTPTLVVAILGVLKAGGVYVPIDPAYPADRMAFIVRDCEASVLLTTGHLRELLPSSSMKTVQVDDAIAGERQGQRAAPARIAADADAAAYVIYTSGSTGRPKGVVVTHAQVGRLFDRTRAWFAFDESDVWTLFHSCAFDFSVWEMWGALLHGGRLVVVPLWDARSADRLYNLLVRERVTILNQTPSAFRELMAEDAIRPPTESSLRLIIFGGEQLDISALAPWMARHGDRRPRLVNMYGITETTVHATYRPLLTADVVSPGGSVIGCPIPDLQIYLLDSRLNPVPIGVPGEIFVGGHGLARGYLGRPDLTAERFRPNPFLADGSRLYQSGDLARRLANGDLEYLGRVDEQVKVRGFRIEPAEIEGALRDHPQIDRSIVVGRTHGGETRLVAYLVGRDGAREPASSLRAFLQTRVPEYMIPAAFVWLDRLPLTGHGKVDRHALPDATIQVEKDAWEAPQTPVEEAVALLWGEVIGGPRVGRTSNFFDLGGHSLLATRVLTRVRDLFRVSVPVLALFDAPTVSAFAAAVSAAEAAPGQAEQIARAWLALRTMTSDEQDRVLNRTV